MQRKLFLALACLIISKSQAQKISELGSLPSYSYQFSLNDFIKQNISVSSQMGFYEIHEVDQRLEYRLININFNYAIGYRYSPSIHFGSGLLFRLVNPGEEISYEIRPSQQVTFTEHAGKLRIRNRLVAEERFFTAGSNQFALRLRYRIGVDLPLSGFEMDPHEFYLNLSNEILSTPTDMNYNTSFNNRPYAALGYQFNETQRIEAGIEWRRQIMDPTIRPDIWFLRISWYYSA